MKISAFVIVVIVLFAFSIFSFWPADALKSVGYKNPRINAIEICGDAVCENPIPISKKTQNYLIDHFNAKNIPIEEYHPFTNNLEQIPILEDRTVLQQSLQGWQITRDDTIVPALGRYNVVVIQVQFQDVKFDPSFDAKKLLDEVANHYKRDSYGKMSWEFEFLPNMYTLPNTLEEYKKFNVPNSPLIQDSIKAASTDKDFANVERVIIIYATGKRTGLDPDPSGYPHGFLRWLDFYDDPTDSKGRLFHVIAGADVEAFGYQEQSNFFIHELGHTLGLPDLYWGKNGHGWDPMSSSINNKAPSFSFWSKEKLGWVDKSSVLTVQRGEKVSVKVDALGLAPTGISAVKIPIDDSYFLIEVREPVGAEINLIPFEYPVPSIGTLYKSGVLVAKIRDYTTGSENPLIHIFPSTQQLATNSLESNRAAFQVGQILIHPDLGKMTVKSKIGSSYELEIDRDPSFLASTDETLYAQLDVPADQPINNTYLEGDTVRVFGKVGRVVENKMAEIIVASDKHTYASGKVMPNPDGNFLYEFKITGPQPKPFTMKVKVSYDKRVLELPIKYLNDEPDPAKTRFDVINGFEVKTDKEIYNFGDTIIISGRVPEIVPGGHKVNINVFGSPLGMTGGSATPNQDGTFSIEHKLTLPRYRETMYVEVYYYLQRTGTSFKMNMASQPEPPEVDPRAKVTQPVWEKYKPVQPIPTTPVQPIPTTPVQPIPTTPVQPIPTTPVQPPPSTQPTAKDTITSQTEPHAKLPVKDENSPLQTINLRLDKYKVNQPTMGQINSVYIQGKVPDYNRGSYITLQIQKPNGQIEEHLLLASNGNYETKILLTRDSPIGQYKITTKYKNFVDESSFEVIKDDKNKKILSDGTNQRTGLNQITKPNTSNQNLKTIPDKFNQSQVRNQGIIERQLQKEEILVNEQKTSKQQIPNTPKSVTMSNYINMLKDVLKQIRELHTDLWDENINNCFKRWDGKTFKELSNGVQVENIILVIGTTKAESGYAFGETDPIPSNSDCDTPIKVTISPKAFSKLSILKVTVFHELSHVGHFVTGTSWLKADTKSLQGTGTSSDKSFGKSIENGLRAINEILAHSESIPLKNRLKNEFKDDVKELDVSIKKECKIIKYYSTKIKALASNKDWWKENKATLEKKTKNVLEKTKNLCPNEYKDALTNINNLFSK